MALDSTESTPSVRKSALLVASMSSFLTPFMGSSINVAAPSIQAEFSLDPITLTWVGTAYLLAAAMFLVPFGKVADNTGRRRIYFIGIIIDTIATSLGMFAFSDISLLVFRFLQGFGDAMIFGTSIAILTAVYPGKQRGQVLGITVAFTYSGLSLGPFFGGLLTNFFGWRSVFLFTVAIDVAILIALHWLRGEWYGEKGQKLDVPGSILYALTLLLTILGFTLLEMGGTFLIFIGIAGLVLFILWETRTMNPVLDVKLFRHNTIFAFSNAAALINYMATFAVTFLMSLYLQEVLGFPPAVAGVILVSQPIVMAAFSPVAGRLSDRIEPRIVASLGMALTSVALILLAFVQKNTELPYIVGTLILLGFGFALFSSPNTNAVMSSVDRRIYGVASATLGTMRLVGQTFSLGITTLMFAIGLGSIKPDNPTYAPLFLNSMNLQFIIFSILCGIGVIASLARGRLREKIPAPLG